MNYYAQITNGVVTAVTQTASPVIAPDMIALDGMHSHLCGYSYVNGEFAAPSPEPAPVAVLTMRQAKLVLHRHGMLDEVNNAVSLADRATQLEWEYSTEVKRDWPTLTVMAAALGLDSFQLDALFAEGATL